MSKKLIILFIFTFFLSTTGLPVSLHYCQMQGSISLSDCEMCSTKEIEEVSCCEEEDSFAVQIKNDIHNNCCELKIIDSSVKENFIPNKEEIRIDKTNIITNLLLDGVYSANYGSKILQSFCDSSPPIQTNDIYLQNSVLLI